MWRHAKSHLANPINPISLDKILDPNIVEINRFTKLVFGLTQSPFILEDPLKQHFQNYMNVYSILVEKIQKDMHVYDLVSGGTNLAEVENLKQKSSELFFEGDFNVH